MATEEPNKEETKASGGPGKKPARARLLSFRLPRGFVKTFFIVSLAFIVVGVVGAAITIHALSRDLPSPARLQTIKPPIKTLVFAANGDTLHEYFRQNRIPLRLETIPEGLKQAVIATEDRGFYNHYGLELRGMMRAVLVNLREGQRVQGASTLTQQLARSLFLHHRKEWTRKFREMLLALQIERTYTKDEILEMYLNTIYFGPGYGVEAASLAFFSKSVTELEPPEYTMLAGVLNNPGFYSPFRHPDRAYNRRAVVLRSMVAAGYMTPDEAEAIGQQEVNIQREQKREPLAPYFVEMVRQYLEENYGVKQLYEDGMRVYTTLDPVTQRAAEASLEAHLSKVELEQKYEMTRVVFDSLYTEPEERPRPQYIQGAVMSIDPLTGDIRALVGGRDFETSKFNRAVQAQRQPGSVFKPFLYAAALQRGWTPASMLLDAPVELETGSDQLWRPVNFDNTFRGPVSLRYALAHSINVPAVRLILDVGTQPVLQMAQAMGITSPLPAVYSLALGAGEANLQELVAAYTAFANHGVRVKPRMFTRITDSRGEVLEEVPVHQEEVLDEATNFLLVDLMRSALQEGTGRSARSHGFVREGAGKTGTTDRYTDAWFVGYTPELVTGVWVGFDQQRSMGNRKTGAAMALPIWASTMIAALDSIPESTFQQPETVMEAFVCVDSGQKPTVACEQIAREIFAAGMEPSRVCEIHQPPAQDLREGVGDFEELDARRNNEFGEFSGGGRR